VCGTGKMRFEEVQESWGMHLLVYYFLIYYRQHFYLFEIDSETPRSGNTKVVHTAPSNLKSPKYIDTLTNRSSN